MINAEQMIEQLKNSINSHSIESIEAVGDNIYEYPDKINEIMNAYKILFAISKDIKVEPNTTQSMLNVLASMLPTLSSPVDGVYERYIIFSKMTESNYNALNTSVVKNKNWGVIYNPLYSTIDNFDGSCLYNIPIYYTDVYSNASFTTLEGTAYKLLMQGYTTSNAVSGYSGKHCQGIVRLSETLKHKISVDFGSVPIVSGAIKVTRSSNYGQTSPVYVNMSYYAEGENGLEEIVICSPTVNPVKLAHGESVWVQLPSEILNDLKSKIATEFVLKYSGTDYNNNYCVYDCSFQLKLDYE